MSRGVVSNDASIQKSAASYLEENAVQSWMQPIMHDLLQSLPPDPLQFVVDCLTHGKEMAMQDPKTGLSVYRQTRLKLVFSSMNTAGTGTVSFEEVKTFATKYGGTSMTGEELQNLFHDFSNSSGGNITEEQFLVFFGRLSWHMTNLEFDAMVKDMLE